ncbi:MAG: GNAT family N-acetyltransferase [Phycisphaeraceae bacterium]
MPPTLATLPIIDAHVHVFDRTQCDAMLADVAYTGAAQLAVQVTGRDVNDPTGAQLRNAVHFKRQRPADIFIFGGLDFADMIRGAPPRIPFAQQAQMLQAMGCDGLKLLTGKPNYRQAINHPLDGPAFQPLLHWLEESRFPVLWHVSDPPEFWSRDTVPLWAKRRGWWYDASVPPRLQIEQEIDRVLRRHPRLNLILPHFFFLSNRLDEAATLLEAHPTFHFDLAPGVEMLHNFTAHRQEAREFFLRFADRIVFGSDFGLSCGWHRDRGMMIRRFLETDEPFAVPQDPAMSPDDRPPLRGLALPTDALKQIYAGNFQRIVAAQPRPLAPDAEQRISALYADESVSLAGDAKRPFAPPPPIRIIDESAMTARDDQRIRQSLCLCFSADADTFGQSRAWHGSGPAFSIVIQHEDRIIAHVGVVDRHLTAGDSLLRVAGIQNVMVLPDHRGQHLADQVMLAAMHEARRRAYDAGLLFCIPALEALYQRCGWTTLPDRPVIRLDAGRECPLPGKNIAMWHPLKLTHFPAGTIHLRGNDW